MLPDLNLVVNQCWKRLRSWQVPPHWSPVDWQDEVIAQAHSAAWEALGDYDTSRGVPLNAFVHSRVIHKVWTRYRQEWSYASHCAPQVDGEELEQAIESFGGSWEIQDPSESFRQSLHDALILLSPGDRWLIEQLFWVGHTEAEIAKLRGVSQPAINKRKRAILSNLCGWLHATEYY
jgi:DNA-directed RNA polymerase specialized sigma24 family protein